MLTSINGKNSLRWQRYPVILLLLLTCLLSPTLSSADVNVAGISLPDTQDMAGDTLQLNGAGVRSKFFIKVYVGSLYLRTKTTSAATALQMSGRKVMRMDVLHGHVAAERIRAAWREGLKANLDMRAYSTLEARLNQFNAFFPDLKNGDVVAMRFDPDSGTELSINGASRGRVPGADFFTALLSVWLGDHPADKTLKNALLGR